jgi:peptide chain release factor 2
VITFDPAALRERLSELEAAMGEAGFWDDQRRAADISAEQARLTRRLQRYETLTRDFEEARELYALDGDLAEELDVHLQPLEQELARVREDALFSGEYDAGDALVTIHAGEGGTDAQDWAEMLVRMYLRWAERRGFKAELVEASPGEEAGLKSAAITVAGENAYGTLKAERGVHRLVRLSPFDSAHRRQTSFA